MAHARTFRFGVELVAPFEGRTWLDTIREIEALGYSSVVMPDHFDEGLGPLSAMAAAAAVTTTLKLAPLVLDTDYRHPVVVARELASIDLLSEGRLELGLGAGWKRKDYDSSGIPMDPPKVRVDRMIEHMQVLKGLFADGPFSFSGEHYTIAELDGTPKPYRGGGPPFVIGGGAPRVLRFAGANADIVGVIASIHSGAVDVAAAQDTLPERMDKKFAWVREGADTVSARPLRRPRVQRVPVARRGDRDRRRARREPRSQLRYRPCVGPRLACGAHRLGERDRRTAPRATRAVGVLLHDHPAR